MAEINITLPDNSVRSVQTGTTPQNVADSIGPGLARAAVVAKVDGEMIDLNTPLSQDCNLELITGDNTVGQDTLLHSTAHLMAQAVRHLYPDVKIAIGPTIENGFYYDFDIDGTFSEDDLAKIEQKMKELAKANYDITRQEITAADAVIFFKNKHEDYKVDIIERIDPSDMITTYTQDDFTDLCRGPHVSKTGKIKHFKLLSTSGAYWRGDEKNKMIQRIYGTAWFSKKEI